MSYLIRIMTRLVFLVMASPLIVMAVSLIAFDGTLCLLQVASTIDPGSSPIGSRPHVVVGAAAAALSLVLRPWSLNNSWVYALIVAGTVGFLALTLLTKGSATVLGQHVHFVLHDVVDAYLCWMSLLFVLVSWKLRAPPSEPHVAGVPQA